MSRRRLAAPRRPRVVPGTGQYCLGNVLRKRSRQHEFGLEHGFDPLHDAVESSRHPGNGGIAAGVGVATIRLFEAGKDELRRSALNVIRQALEAAGVEFTNADQPGVRLRKRRRSKTRRV
jgi:hypothetical protein